MFDDTFNIMSINFIRNQSTRKKSIDLSEATETLHHLNLYHTNPETGGNQTRNFSGDRTFLVIALVDVIGIAIRAQTRADL